MKPFPSLPTFLGNRQSAAVPTLRTAGRQRRTMMTEPLCRSSDVIALHQHEDGSILTFLLGKSRDSSTWFQQRL